MRWTPEPEQALVPREPQVAALQVRDAYNRSSQVKLQAGLATSATGPAGVLTALVVWLLHGLIYRWSATRLSEGLAEQRIDTFAKWLRGWIVDPAGRLLSGLRRQRVKVQQFDGQPNS